MLTASLIKKALKRIQPHDRNKVSKFAYAFEEGNAEMKKILGGKGSGLAEMTRIGLPVPPGFTISTEACQEYNAKNKISDSLWNEIRSHMENLERKMGKKFGDPKNPLLVSVRSGAQISMPGMMDTVLNLGLNDSTVVGLTKVTNDERFALDCYRRFIQMFGNVVLGIHHEKFEKIIVEIKDHHAYKLDTQLSTQNLAQLIGKYKNLIKEQNGSEFLQTPYDQLRLAIQAVFNSWNNERAIAYRRIHNITGLIGTAVNIQSMVFGNNGENSGTGVAFTRNPSTGEKQLFGEFLINAQGEDVVAGIRTPTHIKDLETKMPNIYRELINIQSLLERHYKNMQDIEFTVENKRLFILQTRNGKRSAEAAIKIATDLVAEGLISKKDAILQVNPAQLDQLLHPRIAKKFAEESIAKGLAASPGAAVGRVVFSPDVAVASNEKGGKVILVRKETSPEDIKGMYSAQGILTSRGGMTSHAAVVCRGMGKPCISGCSEIEIDYENHCFKTKKSIIREGDFITLNGSTGEIFWGEAPLEESKLSDLFVQFMQWADSYKKLSIRTNADTPNDAKKARTFGAEGIGLCRTEHMFFETERIPVMREMILSENKADRITALNKLLPMQKQDFIGIFREMDGYPVTIRLLDPPLHEFLPTNEVQIAEVSRATGIDAVHIRATIQKLHEINPMLGHRGCRLAITFPEIYEMQTRAIVEAGFEASKKGIAVIAEIEIPLVTEARELKILRNLVETVIASYPSPLPFEVKIGTMIELPRACLTADEISEYADFFSFGTNDLTQMTYGFSRDDAGKFLNAYLDAGILERDPTESIDRKGVGKLMKMAVDLARANKKNLMIGICGEHGGEGDSVHFCHEIGLDYVSCSPYRIPIARLAAAQAALHF